ncbi:MAG: hypothetical protein L0212_04280 [Acidobacteria bacterium]|nr:hypothetical protein [Acidobacteriota bacterium]
MESICTDWRQAQLTGRQRAMLAFSEKLTHTPWEMKEADVVELRGHGLSDDQILAVVLVAAFFSIATRVADALGVELDPQFTRGTPEYQRFMKS